MNDDRCEHCGAAPFEMRDGWQPECCTGQCGYGWRDPDYEYDRMRDERMAFDEQWCARCQRDAAYREDENAEPCDILNRTIIYEIDDLRYPTEWVEDESGPRCTAFLAIGWAAVALYLGVPGIAAMVASYFIPEEGAANIAVATGAVMIALFLVWMAMLEGFGHLFGVSFGIGALL